MNRYKFLLIMLGALHMASQANAQGFDPACQLYQMEQFAWLESRIGEVSAEQRARLQADKKLAVDYLEKGKRFNKQRAEVFKRVEKKLLPALERDSEYRAAKERETRRKQRADKTMSYEDVRAWQKDKAELERLRVAKLMPSMVRDPEMDTQNSAGNRLTKDSNVEEVGMYLRRVHTDLSRKAKAEIVRKTLADSTKALGLDQKQTAQVRESRPWSQAVSVLGIVRAVTESGHVKEEVIKGLPGSVFDSDANIVTASLAAVSAASLVGGMSGVAKNWSGSPEMPGVRGAMGPATEKTVADLFSYSISNQARAVNVQNKMADAIARHDVPVRRGRSRIERVKVPEPKPIRQEPARLETTMKKVEESAKAAVEVLVRYGSISFNTSIMKYLGQSRRNSDQGTSSQGTSK